MSNIILQTITDILSTSSRTFPEIATELDDRCRDAYKPGTLYGHINQCLAYLINEGRVTSMIDGGAGTVYSQNSNQ